MREAHMRDYEQETRVRVAFIQTVIKAAGARGIVFGASGGKDSVLVGILCKKACDDTVGIILPCDCKRNYEDDRYDALDACDKYGIKVRTVDLGEVKQTIVSALDRGGPLTNAADINIAPRLRMTALYAIAASESRLVAGTSNRSEIHMGYFTKWGDGACDFNPIADLTVTEIYEFLTYLKAPEKIIDKMPSGGLFDGQTDESEMGITYKSIDDFILTGETNETDQAIIARYHAASEHKRSLPAVYS